MQNSNLTYQIDTIEYTDIVVIGSGIAGICAAIAAARLGCDVILLENDAVLGGNSSPNLGIHISGAHSFHPYASETGIVGELEEEGAYLHAKILTHGYHYNIARQWDSLLYNLMSDVGVKVHRRHHAKLPIMDGNRIKSVLVEDLATYKTKLIDVNICVIEASGDGQVAKEAGAQLALERSEGFRMGREAKSEFNERNAPDVADKITLGTSVTALVRKANQPVKFVPPDGTPEFVPGYGYSRDASGNCLYGHSSWHPDAEFCFLWHTETGGQLDTIEDEHEIYEELLKQLYSAWNHIKNEAHPKESENWELVWVSPKAGKRESRRFIGDYILTQTDVENARQFPDAVAYGGYAVDVHDPVGTQVKIIFHSVPPLYSIPYRCLYSKDIDNLFLAGRLVSGTHLALGTVRLQKTLGAAGEAVGTAAHLCKKYNCSPRDVYHHHINKLQQLLLKNDATILGIKNEDPDDLAREAAVTATSESYFECTELTDFLPLDNCTRGIMLWNWGAKVEEVQLYLMNENSAEVPIDLTLSLYQSPKKWKEPNAGKKPPHIKGPANRMEWGNDNTIAKFQTIAQSHAVLPPNFVGWVRFSFPADFKLIEKDVTSDEDRYLLTLPQTSGVSWGRHKATYDFAVRCWATANSTEYVTEPETHLFKLSPRPLYGEAVNVINGYNRRFATNPVNMWISKPGEPLPQSLILDFGEPKSFCQVNLTFDTFYRTYREMPFNCDKEVSEMCVKDYALEIWDGKSWKSIVEVADNYRRHRVHKFDRVTASKLRLTVKATNGAGWTARVYEVRVYDEVM